MGGSPDGFWWREEGAEGLRVAFTGAEAGNLALNVGDDSAAVTGRRRRLEERMGVRPGALRFMNQVHSARVGTVEAGDAPIDGSEELDGLLCADAGVPLAVLVADCLPVLFAARAPGGGWITAAAHAGRRGLLGGILANTVAGLEAAGGTGLQAWIGPSICGRCYEVPAAMQAEACGQLPELAAETSWGTPALDLAAGAAAELGRLDVRVHRVAGCTREDPGLFSYRRDSGCGRFAGLVWTGQGAR
ncbi:polyphenol oxidase family protein [Arthrobacter sp. I2-34]|uniref:Polyphenol oxidase family protein n=1 Tax=Arthrobacter hankyongi TaxID=2904801 RepID=A0ABS9LBM8_9MICC|nr:polyphenol oxidase family protein [Arthrobacter hankyongi]MCG2623857.1 polyphenol oxidase family protein [Arthrobacter hankyongi]